MTTAIETLTGPIQTPDDIACDGTRAAALMLTRRCNMTCGHCSVASGPGIKKEPTDAEVIARADALVAAGVRSVLLTGGEPMLREALAIGLVERLGKAGIPTSMTSNGSWGADPADAGRIVRALHRGGLRLLTISYDRFHADFMDCSPVGNIARACSAEGLAMNLNITRTARDSELAGIIAKTRDLPGIRTRFYDVQPVGRAKHLDPAGMRSNMEGFCNAAGIPVITDDGRVMACNGPSFFQPSTSPLHCSGADEPIAKGLHRHTTNQILEGIRVFGPGRLLQELATLPAFADFAVRDGYRGMCDLCLHLTGTPAAAEALRTHLGSPQLQAEMQAVRRVIQGTGRQLRSLPLLNEIVGPRLLFDATFDPSHRLPASAVQVFGRADLDWSRLTTYLTACGLSGPILPILKDPILERYAPGFFHDAIRRGGEATAIKTLVAREVLRTIGLVLDRAGATAVALKGASRLLESDPSPVGPALGDIDLLVPGGRAAEIHRLLIEAGFGVSRSNPGTQGEAAHHLAPLHHLGIAVEIHSRVAEPHTGIPEAALLAGIRPLRGPFQALSPEAHFLHVVAHNAWHMFKLGLKSAWSARRILEAHPDFDWTALLALVRQFRGARAFWAPLRVWHRELGLGVPEAVLAHAPCDRFQKRVDRIARAHLFTSIGKAGEKEPFLVPALGLLLAGGPGTSLAQLPGWAGLAARELAFRSKWSLQALRTAPSPAVWAQNNLRSLAGTYRLIVAG